MMNEFIGVVPFLAYMQSFCLLLLFWLCLLPKQALENILEISLPQSNVGNNKRFIDIIALYGRLP
jgi:hypothetical protein